MTDTIHIILLVMLIYGGVLGVAALRRFPEQPVIVVASLLIAALLPTFISFLFLKEISVYAGGAVAVMAWFLFRDIYRRGALQEEE